MSDTTYNGWKNYETWNAALWMDNDEPTYEIAKHIAHKAARGRCRAPYAAFVSAMESCGCDRTGDDILWRDKRISRRDMNANMLELIS